MTDSRPQESTPHSERDLLSDPVSAPPPRSEGSLLWRAAGMVRTIRPHQWVKNGFVLAPMVFAKEIFEPALLLRAAGAFGVFCLLAGAVYAMNDMADIEADRLHPVKRYRPIPSGRVPVAWARVLVVGLIVVALGGSLAIELALRAMDESPFPGLFIGTTAAYFAINLAYSFKLKQVAYVDVSIIAAGFVMRVMAGGFATDVHVSRYLLLCTALLALFLGLGKRRHELTSSRKNAKKQRAALEMYSQRGLDIALWATALATIGTYLAYTLDHHTREFFQTDWLWPSTLFVVLGVGRFVALVQNRPQAESPTQEMLKDGPFVFIMLLWVALVMWVVYHLQPGA